MLPNQSLVILANRLKTGRAGLHTSRSKIAADASSSFSNHLRFVLVADRERALKKGSAYPSLLSVR
jgi:hypothetical protein